MSIRPALVRLLVVSTLERRFVAREGLRLLLDLVRAAAVLSSVGFALSRFAGP